MVLRERLRPEVGPTLRRRLGAAVFAGLAGISVIGGWSVITGVTARVAPLDIDMNRRFRVPKLNASTVFRQTTAAVTPFSRPFVARPLVSPLTDVSVEVTDWLIIGGLVGTLCHARSRGRLESLGGATGLALVATGPFLAIATFVVSHVSFAIPSRYGLAAAPALVTLLAASLHKRWIQFLVGGCAVFTAASTTILLALNR